MHYFFRDLHKWFTVIKKSGLAWSLTSILLKDMHGTATPSILCIHV